MPLTSERVVHYKNAGYTHYVQFETKLHIADAWVFGGYPTTADALPFHEKGIASRVFAKEIRNPIFITLEDSRAALRESQAHEKSTKEAHRA